jgi:hypothetical protein
LNLGCKWAALRDLRILQVTKLVVNSKNLNKKQRRKSKRKKKKKSSRRILREVFEKIVCGMGASSEEATREAASSI